MAAPQNVITVIFDFDDTLTDDSTTRLLEAHGIDTRDFWQNRVKQFVDAGWDPPLAYLSLMLDLVGEGKPLGNLTNAALRSFGGSLNFYPGIPQIFDDLQELVKEHRLSRPAVEFYIVSGGLEEVIRGSRIAPFFSGIWGSRFFEQDARVQRVMNALSFTEKTKYLFAINKGVDAACRQEPYLVNKHIPPPDRRVPFENMIYIGDGLTDVPCFSLLQQFGGTTFGVFDPLKEGSPKKAWETLAAPRRVTTMNSPRYGHTDDLGALLRAAVKQICLKMDVRTRTAH